MNKAQLIDAVASESGGSKTDARRSIDAFIKVTAQALEKGDKITLVGFGSFYVAKQQGRTGRNPRTGASIKIAPKSVVKFKPGLELNAKVNL